MPQTFSEWCQRVVDEPSYDGSSWSQCPSTVEETEKLAWGLRELAKANRLEAPEAFFLFGAVDAGMPPLDDRVKGLVEDVLMSLLENGPAAVCTEIARGLAAIDSREGLRRLAEMVATAVEHDQPCRFAESFVLRRVRDTTRHAYVLFPTLDRVLAAKPSEQDPDWHADICDHIRELKRRIRT